MHVLFAFWKLKNSNLITSWLAHFNDISLYFQMKSDYSNGIRFHGDASRKENDCEKNNRNVLYSRVHLMCFVLIHMDALFIHLVSIKKVNGHQFITLVELNVIFNG